VLAHPAITAVIVGARRPEQVDELAGAAELRLSEEELAELRRS
jgi:aryl-alcohol dehydrogenase-like predicted oxidoreductase